MNLIEEFNEFYMTLSCKSFEDQKKINDWIADKLKAGGIASYYTSPLALREEYKAEYGFDACGMVEHKEKIFDFTYNPSYVKWLERKLCGGEAGE